MKKLKEESKQVMFTIEKKHVDVIDYYANKVERSRSQFVRGLVLNGLDDAKIMNALGVFDLVKFIKGSGQMKLPENKKIKG